MTRMLLGAMLAIIAATSLYAGNWVCSDCNTVPPGGIYCCQSCGRTVAVADAELVGTKSASKDIFGTTQGDHWHIYRCPYCGNLTTVNIGNITEMRDRASRKFQEDAEEFRKNCEQLHNAAGTCFIATAAYGSPDEADVVILRQFRDEYLLTNAPGRAFVRVYYRASPPVARAIAKSEQAKWLVRTELIPLVAVARILTKQ